MRRKKRTPEERMNEAFEKRSVKSAKAILSKHEFTPEEATNFLYGTIRFLESPEVLEMLMKMGAKADQTIMYTTVWKCAYLSETVGGYAASLRMLELLLAYGAKPYAVAVQLAVECDCAKALTILLKAGGDACSNRNAPLNKAVGNGCYKCAQILMEYGARSEDVSPKILKQAEKLSKKHAHFAATIMALQGAKIEID